MSGEKVITLFVEKDIFIRITNNREEADYVIESGKKQIIHSKTDEELIKEYLQDKGISLNSGGFNYLIMAINIVCEKLENNKKYSLTKDVYPLIAEKYSVTASSVDRAIWNSIHRSLEDGTGPKRFIEKFKLGM